MGTLWDKAGPRIKEPAGTTYVLCDLGQATHFPVPQYPRVCYTYLIVWEQHWHHTFSLSSLPPCSFPVEADFWRKFGEDTGKEIKEQAIKEQAISASWPALKVPPFPTPPTPLPKNLPSEKSSVPLFYVSFSSLVPSLVKTLKLKWS